jgi:hypothetical protein
MWEVNNRLRGKQAKSTGSVASFDWTDEIIPFLPKKSGSEVSEAMNKRIGDGVQEITKKTNRSRVMYRRVICREGDSGFSLQHFNAIHHDN